MVDGEMPWPKGYKPKDKQVLVRISSSELKEIRDAADVDELPVTTWLRMTAVRVAREQKAARKAKGRES